MHARTIDVPKEVPKRGIKQYVYAEAERLEKRFRTGIDESENTVHKYLDAVSAVLQDAAKNDILLYNPAHRVEKVRVEKGTPFGISSPPICWNMVPASR